MTARVCDMQAIFLIELLSQFRSNRCPTSLSRPFRELLRIVRILVRPLSQPCLTT